MKMADRFASQGYSLKKQTQRSNDKTIIACIFLSPPTEAAPAAMGVTLKIASFFQIWSLELAGEWEQKTFSMNNNKHLYTKYIHTQ